MKLLRSLIFSIYFIIVILTLSILLLPACCVKDKRKFVDKVGWLWTKMILFGLKNICKINWRILGKKNLPKKDGFIIAGKHQSMWETFIMYHVLRTAPVFILKKQLLKVPIWGWGLGISSNISIDRKGGSRALKRMIKLAKERLKQGHNIIIFPQGTRVPVGKTTKEYPYKSGILGVVKALKCDVVPMTLNSGKFWGKRQFIKTPGTITMKFLKPIKYSKIKKMGKKGFMEKLERMVEGGVN